MKVLDVASLKEGIHATLQEIEKVQSQLSRVQRGIRDIIALDQYLKGQMGEAIRSFYKQIHEPFLIFIHQSLTDYAGKLQNIEQAIRSYERDENGLIRQEFLDYHVKRGLDRTEDIASDLVARTNSEIASIADLVSLPRLDMSELRFVVHKGRQQTRQIANQLHELDHAQTKNLSEVEEKLDVMKQYTSEMKRTFNRSSQSINPLGLPSIYHLPTLPAIMKSIYGEPEVEEEKEDNFFVKGLKVTGSSIKGVGIGLFDVGKDTVVGLYDAVTDPKGTVESLYHSVTNPVETYKYIEKAIVDSYERDMINGDAESRSHWVAYALGTTATAVVGTKGAGTITKTGVATTKTAVQKSVTTAQNALESPRLAELLPYGPRMQFVTPEGLPINVINGPVKRDQLISMAKVTETKGTGYGNKLKLEAFTKAVLETKPMNSPIPEKWAKKGGKISIADNGTWTYTNKSGIAVSYPNGFPDFTPYVHPNVKPVKIDVHSPKNNPKDFENANIAAKLTKDTDPPIISIRKPPEGYTWHHHQDGKTMMLVDEDIHREFRHIGGQSIINGKNK